MPEQKLVVELPTDLSQLNMAEMKALLLEKESESNSVPPESLGSFLDSLEREMLDANPDMDREKLRDELSVL